MRSLWTVSQRTAASQTPLFHRIITPVIVARPVCCVHSLGDVHMKCSSIPISAAAACLIVMSLAAEAQVLWQKASYGMTVAQVKQAFPNAIEPSDGGTLYSGAKELLRERDVEVAGEKFDAGFLFNAGKLEQVTLKAKERKRFGLMFPTFEQIRILLRARYGRELSSDVERGSTMSTAKAEFLHGKTNISVLLLGVSDNSALLNINYQVRLAREAEKL
jgi:hypothetical protein